MTKEAPHLLSAVCRGISADKFAPRQKGLDRFLTLVTGRPPIRLPPGKAPRHHLESEPVAIAPQNGRVAAGADVVERRQVERVAANRPNWRRI